MTVYGEYDGDESWDETSPRRRWALIGFVVLAVLTLIIGFGALALSLTGDDDPKATSAPGSGLSPSPTAEITVPPTTEAPVPTTAPATPSRAPSRTPSRKPAVKVPPPPPPVAAPTNTANCPTFPGPVATHAQIRTALNTASKRTYWASTPEIMVPERLLQATAFTESSWRSAVLACDGGIGLMQIMPGTVTQLNSRFGTSWNVNQLQGNAYLGGQYLAWSTKYLGDAFYGGSYDLAAVVNGITLRDAVISAYNNGAGAVFPDRGMAGITNWNYVNSVKQHMQSCPCDAF